MAALNARVDRQEAMFEAVLERFSSLVPPTSRETSQVLGGGPGLENAPVPVMQMAAQGPVPGPAPLIITNGGVHPDGYIYIGMNQGASVWGHADVVASSV